MAGWRVHLCPRDRHEDLFWLESQAQTNHFIEKVAKENPKLGTKLLPLTALLFTKLLER